MSSSRVATRIASLQKFSKKYKKKIEIEEEQLVSKELKCRKILIMRL